MNPRQVVTSKRVKENHIIFIPWLPLVKSWSSSLYCYLQKNLLVIFKNSSNFWFPVVEWLSEICAWSLFAILVIGPLPYQLFYYIIVLVNNCIGSSCETVIFYILASLERGHLGTIMYGLQDGLRDWCLLIFLLRANRYILVGLWSSYSISIYSDFYLYSIDQDCVGCI